jgi:nickel-dependent lactate racemase
VRSLSQGLIGEPVRVRVNREVVEADATLLVGPVFPHELIGFSGGHKYLFPGVAGPEMVDYTHWLGSLIGNLAINGRCDTPPRAVIEAAARLVPGRREALCLVMKGHETRGLYLGSVAEAWRAAVDLSAELNVIRMPRAFHTVVACVPPRYEDLWTGSKCMTKLEPVVADGGKLILLAPHIRSPAVSYAGGGWHERVGYHVRDYILAHRQRYADVPLAVLADLVQLPGEGSYRDGVERRRIQVLVATGIPEATCRSINLDYVDPATVDLAALEGRENEGIFVAREAGETLYRLAGE